MNEKYLKLLPAVENIIRNNSRYDVVSLVGLIAASTGIPVIHVAEYLNTTSPSPELTQHIVRIKEFYKLC